MDIYELETASGVVVSVGGQLPQNIALKLQESGKAKVLGTDPHDIDKAEDRHKFSSILDSIGVDQPAWKELTSESVPVMSMPARNESSDWSNSRRLSSRSTVTESSKLSSGICQLASFGSPVINSGEYRFPSQPASCPGAWPPGAAGDPVPTEPRSEG